MRVRFRVKVRGGGRGRVRIRVRAAERRAVRRVKHIAVKLPSRLVRARNRTTNQS